MKRQFAHPGNGYVEEVGDAALLLTWLLGPIYLAYRGAWAAALVTLFIGGAAIIAGVLLVFVAIPTWVGIVVGYFLASGAWAWAMQPLLARSYLKRGWREL